MVKVKVKLFGNLRRHTGEAVVSASGKTVWDVLAVLFAQYPTLKTAVIDNGQLRPHIRVMVNGHDSELMDGLETAVSNNDQIAIFPPIAGG
ncbi:MAG: MoaD/ThiS family protein [Chloroflexi bacterium]|nr:MoaD/ThiS family protein [Chloroflexota bacterium]